MTTTEPAAAAPAWRELSAALAHARSTGQALTAAAEVAPWAQAVQSEEHAYAVQDDVAARLGWARSGEAALHWKSGGTSRAGPFSHSPLDPAGIGRVDSRCPLLGIEAEIALRLAHDVPAEAAQYMSPEEAAGCIDAMAVSAELVASRWTEQLDAPALLRMADHQSHGALMLGPWQRFRPMDWAHCRWHIRQGAAAIEHTGGHALNDPAGVVQACLRHITRHGAKALAGTIVTTGAWHGMQRLSADSLKGALIEVGFDAFEPVTFKIAP